MTLTQEQPTTDGRELFSPELRRLLATDVCKRNPDISMDLAERGLGQMAAFLAAGTRKKLPLSPSELVDECWHAFLLRTEAYTEFCERIAGRFIHHQPEYLDRDVHGGAAAIRQRTIDAIAESGFVVDHALWPEVALADCHQCYAGCHDSPGGR